MRASKQIGLLLFFACTFMACEKFETTEEADTFYHIQSDGTELPVWVKGNTASNKFVIFINGGPGLTSLDIAKIDMLGWENSLEKEFALVYYDQRGTGNAQGLIDDQTLTMEQYVKELKLVVQSIKAQYQESEVYLMGHSFGGFIGQHFLLEDGNQELITGWININGSTIVDVEKEWVYRLKFLEDIAHEKMNENPAKWTEVLEWVDANNPIISKEQKSEWRGFIGQPGDGVLPEENAEISGGDMLRIVFASSYNIFPAYLSSNLSEVGRLMYEDIKGVDLLPKLNQLTLPTLYLWGKYDDIIPPQLGRAAFDLMGTTDDEKRLVLFESSGHQPFINEPEAFQAAVIDFVKNY